MCVQLDKQRCPPLTQEADDARGTETTVVNTCKARPMPFFRLNLQEFSHNVQYVSKYVCV